MTIGPRIERLAVGAFVLALLGGAVIVLSFFAIPQANRDVVFQLVGGINALAGLVVGGYFRAMNDGHVTVDNRPDEPIPTTRTTIPKPEFGDEE